MKNTIVFILLALLSLNASAQPPQKMSYQAVVRNLNNNLVSNTTIGMKISLLQGGTSGSTIYSELHFPSTNSNGLVSLEIGGGTVVNGNFSTISWNSGPYYVKTETDPSGGTNYSITGTSQLLSVPYALYAERSGRMSDYAIIEEQYPLNSFPPNLNASGSAFVPNLRPLNTIVASNGSSISLNSFSNTISIQPGLYKVRITCPSYLQYNQNQGGTDSYLVFSGSLSNTINSYFYSNSNQTVMELEGVIQVNNPEIFTLNQYIRSAYTNPGLPYLVPNQTSNTLARVFIQRL